ncbi:MAG: translocation/assembly module TamB domain-containing protein, partial [Lacisediminimonas sp.]|nr:translocation/assembly module TamB domain-containing protein [Lacisediminimonas sp.]
KGKLRGQPLDLQLAAHGALSQVAVGGKTGPAWQGSIDQLDHRSFPRLTLREPLALRVSADTLELGAARMVLEQASIDLSHLLWRDGLVRSAGRLQSLNVAHLLALQRELTGKELPLSSDLVFDGSWDVSLAGRASGSFKLVRTRGDLRLKTTRGDNPMGINRLSLDGRFEGERLQVEAVLDTARLGRLDADGAIGLVQQQQLMVLGPQSTLALRLRANVARLSNVASIAGGRLALEGRLDADLRAGGTLAAPVISGELLAQGLALTLFDQGVRLHDGTARLALTNNMLELQEVLFRGGRGTLRASGRIPLDSNSQELGANIVAERLQLLADPSRQLTVSGKAVLANRGGQLQVIGNFTVDDALFSLPEKSAPSLGSDVVVIDRLPGQGAAPATVAASAATKGSTAAAAPQAPGLLPPRVELELDLGRN